MLAFDPDILDQGHQFFIQEAPELLQVLEQELRSLHQTPFPRGENDLQLYRLTQAIRSLEEGATRMGLFDVQAIAHRLEAVLNTIEAEGCKLLPEGEKLLLQALESLRSPLIQEIQMGYHDDRNTLLFADEVFSNLEAHLMKLDTDDLVASSHDDWRQTLDDLEDLLNQDGGLFQDFGAPPPIPPEDQPHPGTVEAKKEEPQAKPKSLSEDPPELVDKLSDRLQNARIYQTPNISNTIRVDLSRLEKLNNLIGELFIQETGSNLQIHQLQDRIQSLSQRFKQFELFTKELNNWAYRSQSIKAVLQNSKNYSSSHIYQSNGFPLPHADFDPLQMDSYNHLYTLAQAMSEELAQLGEAMQDTTLLCRQAQGTQKRRQQTVKQIRDGLLKVRMFPVGEILQRFPRMLRDLAAQYQKQVAVKISGSNTLMDKSVLEKLLDPIVHLVRNAFDHGIEPPAVREAQGKSPQATIEIRAYHRGNQTYIEVRDDGRGIDIEAVRQKVIARQLLSEAEAHELSRDRLYEYIFAPGFSTAAKVSELSGRGIGLDVVQDQIRTLKGSITLFSEPGKGTTFVLRLPLTLTIAKLLVFSINSQRMAIPVDALASIVTAAPDEIKTESDQQYYRWREDWIPICPQHHFLPFTPIRMTGEQLQAIPLPLEDKVPLLLVAHGSSAIAVQVDQILQEQELVIKPLGRAVKTPAHLYGCTILGDGSLVPVLDGQGLMQSGALLSISSTHPLQLPVLPPTILVVDDSLTVRQSMVFTLEKAGYRVLQARDGREGLLQLQQEPMIKVVFCDVEMPRMNGFEFLSQSHQEFGDAAPPVIMLTSRGGEKHRQTAKELGAYTYLTKPYLEQDLLKTVEDLRNPESKRSSMLKPQPEIQLVAEQ